MTHLTTARATSNSMADHTQEIHEQLGRLYLILSRPLTEESRAESLGIVHQTMANVRALTERVDYIKLSVKGVESVLISGIKVLAETMLGELPRATDSYEEKPYDDHEFSTRG